MPYAKANRRLEIGTKTHGMKNQACTTKLTLVVERLILKSESSLRSQRQQTRCFAWKQEGNVGTSQTSTDSFPNEWRFNLIGAAQWRIVSRFL